MTLDEEIRAHIDANTKSRSFKPYGTKNRLVGGEIISLSKRQNRQLNKKNHRPPKVFYGRSREN